MPADIRWLYHRNSWDTCRKAQEFLEHTAVGVGEKVVANKTKFGAAEVLTLAKKVKRVIATRGKRVVTLDLKKAKPTDDELLAVLLGPTGNLRAPAAVVGDTLVVGFNPDVYGELLGIS